MTKIEGEKYHGTVDLLVGGTPCQDVSVAGKRKGFAGERSGLAFSYIRLLETMRPRWFVWENVPGVLSSNGGEDFKAFVRSIDEIGYSCAWRVLDAQYVRVDGYPRAVPQRRRRVFVVGHIGADWRYPASVLFEPEGLPRNTPPRRRAGTGVARSVTASTGGASGKEQQLDFVGGDGQPLNAIESGRGFYSESDAAQTLEAHEDQHRRNVIFAHETGPGFWQGGNISGTLRAEGENRPSRPSNIVCMATGQGNAETGENCAVNLTCNHEAPIICAGFCQGASPTAGGIGYHEQVSPTIKAGESGTAQVPAVICVHGSQDPITNTDHANAVNRNNGLENCVCQYGEVAGTLTERHDSSPCDDRGMNIVYENHMQDSRVRECGGCSPQINAKAGTGGGNLPLVMRDEEPIGFIKNDAGGEQQGYWTGAFPTIRSRATPAVAIAENIIGRQVENGGNGVGAKEEVAYTQNCTDVMGVSQNETVRRLTPVECERLMGFPDNWTRIPWRGKQELDCPDSPRYKACGNSMCVNVMRWIGMRIELVESKGVSC
jgi:site-specific DNA-cytosine methylase